VSRNARLPVTIVKYGGNDIIVSIKKWDSGRVFSRVSENQNQGYHSDQSQRTQPIQQTNQNARQIDLAVGCAGKCVWASDDRVWFYFWLIKKVARVSQPIIKPKNAKPDQLRIAFDTQVKTTLSSRTQLFKGRIDSVVCFVNTYPLNIDLSNA